VFYPIAYIIIPKQTKSKEDLKRLMDMKQRLGDKMALNSKLWHATNDQHYRAELETEDNISKSKIDDIVVELKKL
jgi:hypothetical protein